MGSGGICGEAPLGQLAADEVEVPDLDEGVHSRAGQPAAAGVEGEVMDGRAMAGEPEQGPGPGRLVDGVEGDCALLRADRQDSSVGREGQAGVDADGLVGRPD